MKCPCRSQWVTGKLSVPLGRGQLLKAKCMPLTGTVMGTGQDLQTATTPRCVHKAFCCGFWETRLPPDVWDVVCQPALNTWAHGSSVRPRGHARCRAAQAARHGSSSRPREGGRVPAARQGSEWKTVTYRKLCEACLVSGGYRWADNTSTGNRC